MSPVFRFLTLAVIPLLVSCARPPAWYMHTLEADQAMDRGDYKAAEKLVKQAYIEAHGKKDPKLSLANAFARLGDHYFDIGKEKGPDGYKVPYKRASQFYRREHELMAESGGVPERHLFDRRRRYVEAATGARLYEYARPVYPKIIQGLNKFPDLGPRDEIRMYFGYAFCLKRLDEFESAEEWFNKDIERCQKILEDDPGAKWAAKENVYALRWLANTLMHMGRYEEAKAANLKQIELIESEKVGSQARDNLLRAAKKQKNRIDNSLVIYRK